MRMIFKLKINKSKCTNCGTCEKGCPTNNIQYSNNQFTHKHNCHLCMKCMAVCPRKAIQVNGKDKVRLQSDGI